MVRVENGPTSLRLWPVDVARMRAKTVHAKSVLVTPTLEFTAYPTVGECG
jgi:hypothetical protein